MAKWKLARGKKKKKPNLQAVPCLMVVVFGALLLALLFFAVMQTAE